LKIEPYKQNSNFLYVYKTVIVLFTFIFLDCEKIFDCAINRKPELEEKALKFGNTGLSYNENIKVSIKNRDNDDYLIDNIKINGNLPEGVNYDINSLTIVLSGNPTKNGEYNFEIVAVVKNKNINANEGNGLCNDTSKKVYTITVY
jgi:hypothetical protein